MAAVLQAEVDSSIRDPDSKSESNTPILTRFGYIVLPEEGVVDQPEKTGNKAAVVAVGEASRAVEEEPNTEELFSLEEGNEEPSVGEGAEAVSTSRKVELFNLADSEGTTSDRVSSNTH